MRRKLNVGVRRSSLSTTRTGSNLLPMLQEPCPIRENWPTKIAEQAVENSRSVKLVSEQTLETSESSPLVLLGCSCNRKTTRQPSRLLAGSFSSSQEHPPS